MAVHAAQPVVQVVNGDKQDVGVGRLGWFIVGCDIAGTQGNDQK
jgi:hypothetical protein